MENLELYINENGTYTSPRNGKEYKSLKAFRAHWFCKPGTGGWSNVNNTKVKCQYCKAERTQPNLERHEEACHLNPVNLQECVVCSKPIKNYKHSKGTCSRSCANIHFRSGENNGNFAGRYRTTCFHYHKKECVVCGEDKIVAVHHNDHNHYNNDPENLIPLCPTHHQYVHSQYVGEVQPIIDAYVESRKTVSV